MHALCFSHRQWLPCQTWKVKLGTVSNGFPFAAETHMLLLLHLGRPIRHYTIEYIRIVFFCFHVNLFSPLPLCGSFACISHYLAGMYFEIVFSVDGARVGRSVGRLCNTASPQSCVIFPHSKWRRWIVSPREFFSFLHLVHGHSLGGCFLCTYSQYSVHFLDHVQRETKGSTSIPWLLLLLTQRLEQGFTLWAELASSWAWPSF